ncbi:hypothetical protein L7F22_028543 [Adiantum nelumboides]|nr:hypothetical protein [Adiantum nelumboides]
MMNSKKRLLVVFFVFTVLPFAVANAVFDDEDSVLDYPISPHLSRRSLQQFSFPINPLLGLLNPNLRAAYVALQAWKAAITSDPNGITATWVGYNVCNYTGVFCAPPPDFSCEKVVAGIDLNHANIAGTLPEKLGLLTYLALFHINTNRFSGSLPKSIVAWHLLYELDVSNNLLSGTFPIAALFLPNLAFLDVRFNQFTGGLPKDLFVKPLDAIFVNDNKFSGSIPRTLGDSPASVIVVARNEFSGTIPTSIGRMGLTLNEIIFLGNKLEGCIPPQVGQLIKLTVLDVGLNMLSGELPTSIGNMLSLEQLNVAYNLLSGMIPSQICALPHLENFTASFNFFTGEGGNCPALPSRGVIFDDRVDCIPGRPDQRSSSECSAFFQTEQLCPAPKPPAPPADPSYTYKSPPPPYVYPSSPPAYPSPPLPSPTHPHPPPPSKKSSSSSTTHRSPPYRAIPPYVKSPPYPDAPSYP